MQFSNVEPRSWPKVYSKFSFDVDSKTFSDFFLPSTKQPVNASSSRISLTCVPHRVPASHQDGTHHIEHFVSNLSVALILFQGFSSLLHSAYFVIR